MLKLFDKVIIKKKNVSGYIIEIDASDELMPPKYLVEVSDDEKGDYKNISEVILWCEWDEIEET